MKIKVIQEDGKFQYYALISTLRFNLEFFKRLDSAGYNWEFIYEYESK